MQTDQLVRKLKDDPSFLEFQAYVINKIYELNSIHGLEGMNNERAGEEAKVRAKAIGKLEDILSPFLDFKEKEEPSDEDIRNAKGKYGL